MIDQETLDWAHQRESWQAWEEPWFKRRCPVSYFFLNLLRRIGL